MINRVFTRFYTTSLKKKSIGFVFDIDGVLLKGKNAIPKAKETLTTLQDLKIPFLLFTNGGGISEFEKISEVNEKLNMENELTESQIVLSHTPLRSLNKKFKRVLIIGGKNDSLRKVGKDYGFEETILPVDIIRYNSSIWPFHRYTKEEISKWSINPSISKLDTKPIDSILVFNDPRDMGTDVQIIMDLLNSENGQLGTIKSEDKFKINEPSLPIIFSNNDLLWSNDFKIPRFGQGAFKIMIESLYSKLNNGNLLKSTVLGKPERLSYLFAHNYLINYKLKLDGLSQNDNDSELVELGQDIPNDKLNLFDNIYMVGDNPESDIKGANLYGWNSILVKTGVYKDGDFEKNPNLFKPNVGIFKDVQSGVFEVLKQNRYL